MSEIDTFDIVAPPILAVVFTGVCYLWARGVRRGQPLTQVQRGMILYASIFALGMAYMILFQDEIGAFLHWRQAWIGAIVIWGGVVGVTAWLMGRKKRNKTNVKQA